MAFCFAFINYWVKANGNNKILLWKWFELVKELLDEAGFVRNANTVYVALLSANVFDCYDRYYASLDIKQCNAIKQFLHMYEVKIHQADIGQFGVEVKISVYDYFVQECSVASKILSVVWCEV